MRIQTFSIVVGTKACNAKCPFCVSRMTGFAPVIGKPREINAAHLEKACRLAQIGGTTTVLLTGKGEPTLYPDEITRYLTALEPWRFPFIELQTNGTLLDRLPLRDWKHCGLNTIALSAVSDRPDENRAVYGDAYRDLPQTVSCLKKHDFTVRLCIMMMKGAVDSPERVDNVIAFCEEHGVDQLTMRPIREPAASSDDAASAYVRDRGLSQEQENANAQRIRTRGTKLLSLMHGAEVYDVDGQNVCLADCLTNDPESGDIRTLIFYGDGRLCYDWQYDGAVLMAGAPDRA